MACMAISLNLSGIETRPLATLKLRYQVAIQGLVRAQSGQAVTGSG